MRDVYKKTECNSLEEYNPGKKRKLLLVFDDMIADMINNKKLNSIVTEFFIRGRKLNNYIIFLLHNLVLKCQKVLDYILHIFLI